MKAGGSPPAFFCCQAYVPEERAMPSPFPGMNPYLEQDDVWHDFHQLFPSAVLAQLAARIAPRYIMKVDQHIFIHELSASERRILGRPEIYVVPSGSSVPLSSGNTATLTPLVPVVLPSVDIERQPFIEIRDRANREVVTVIELLSPANKYAGPDREQYVGNRSVYLQSRTHLVEIDLLRGGPRLPYYAEIASEYAAFISRWHERPQAGAIPIRLRQPLPLIPIPLEPPDPDVYLDLKAVIDRIHDEAQFATYIYQGQPKPALSPEDAAWAATFLPAPAGSVPPP
jgi:hypothetical protein